MTRAKLASLIAKREGLKSQTQIGNIREIIKALEIAEAEHIVSGSQELGPVDVIVAGAQPRAERLYRREAKLKRKK